MNLEQILGPYLSDARFLGVAVLDKNTAYLRAQIRSLDEGGVNHTLMLRWERGEWGQYMIPTVTTSHAVFGSAADRTVLALCPDGRVHVANTDGFSWEDIDPTDGGPNALRAMVEIRNIDGEAYACGMARIAYRRNRAGWHRIDAGARDAEGINPIGGFKSIDGFVLGHLYAGGFEGEIWRRPADGQWQLCPSVTNVRFTKLACIDGWVYACGGVGVVVRGRDDAWLIVPNELTEDPLWGIAAFRGTVYVASAGALFRIGAEGLEPVETGTGAQTTGELASDGEILWAVGERDAMFTRDGKTWELAASLPAPV
jgi:hypothetical protein